MPRFGELVEILQPGHKTRIVDIGANPIDGSPPYVPLLQAELAELVGFEPQAEGLQELESKKGPHETYLPYAIGDGKEHMLNVCFTPGFTSLLEPDDTVFAHFQILAPVAKVKERIPIQTHRLDDVKEIRGIDYLKMDIQGFELAVLQNARTALKDAVAIQTEVSFVPLYKDQPSFGEIDLEMRSQGFIAHAMPKLKRWIIAPTIIDGNPRKGLNQILEGDMVYVKDFMRPEGMSDEQLKQLCLIAHSCYQSVDLAARCIYVLEQRNSVPAGSRKKYFAAIAGRQI